MRAKVTVKKLPKDSMMNLHDELGRGKIGDQEVRFCQHINGACFWLSVDSQLYQVDTEELMNSVVSAVLGNVLKIVSYSFCETATAQHFTPWHIRKLTDVGQKFGGGADTKALCGREVAWDLSVPIISERLSNPRITCDVCALKYKEQNNDYRKED